MSEKEEPLTFLGPSELGSDEVFEMYCETCYRDGKHAIASAFCTVCISYLCSTCLDYMGSSYRNIFACLGIAYHKNVCTEKCPIHSKEILKFQCLTCDTFVCSTCKRNDHKGTCDLKYLPDIVKDLEKGNELKQLISEWNEISRKMADIDIKSKPQQEQIDKISTNLKIGIKKEKDSLFEEFEKEAEQIEEGARSVIKSNEEMKKYVRDKIVSLSQEIGCLDHGISQISSSPTKEKYKLFIKMKDISPKLTEIVKDIDILTKHTTKDNSFRNELQKHANDLKERVVHFGKNAREFNIHKKKIIVEPKRKVARFVCDINVSSLFDNGSCHIGDCCLLSEQYLIACDKTNSSVKLIDTKIGKVIYVRRIRTVPEAAAKVTDTEFALVHPCDNDKEKSIIQFLTVTDSRSLEFQTGFMITQMYCTNIVYHDNDTFIISMWANHQGKVQIVDMTGHVLADIENNTKGEKLFKCPNYLTINSDGTMLYVSDWYRNCITAINLENRAVKELRHRFWHPEGISTDKEGLLYICENGTNRIHVFHPEDNISPPDVLLEDTSANWQPLAVCYSLSDRKLYVSQYGLNFIKVYEINDCVTL
ncbi:uncharacterized protein LOC132717619 [Ruditapes philippinarum]|uniref:uncharacterized protein LOC132717619 n=1 Tax=Ruditapes philippinarum TaxID=129788 RepID=UPI00295B1A9F|nr:uncharacterized protein LOC132717619 [Ruditapes philippinarum]